MYINNNDFLLIPPNIEMSSNTFSQIITETQQAHKMRSDSYAKLEDALNGRCVVSLFIAFNKHVPLSPMDSDILEETLKNSDTSKGITLLLDAPGGDGLTAERIIKVCRNYSNNNFHVIVPARAKSAATMICLGADKIFMSDSSELGPIDPQVLFDIRRGLEWVAAHYIVKTYDDLFSQAKDMQDGNIEPLLQQLQRFNAVLIEQLRSAQKLSEDIAVATLKSGMLSGLEEEAIKEKIKAFTDPEQTMSHGRGIYAYKAGKCDLSIEILDTKNQLWDLIWSLYMRCKFVVDNTEAAKLIETKSLSFVGA